MKQFRRNDPEVKEAEVVAASSGRGTTLQSSREAGKARDVGESSKRIRHGVKWATTLKMNIMRSRFPSNR